MLSIFPELFTYDYFAIFLLRVAVGVFFIVYAASLLDQARGARTSDTETSNDDSRWARKGTALGLLEFVGGIFLVAGFLLQPTAIMLAVAALGHSIGCFRSKKEGYGQLFLFLFILLVSLVFLGPGYLSIDIPL